MEQIFKKIVVIRMRMDERTMEPMLSFYMFGFHIGSAKYNRFSGFFDEITKEEYFLGK